MFVNIFYTTSYRVTYSDVGDICSICEAEFQKITLPSVSIYFLKSALTYGFTKRMYVHCTGL